MQEATKKNVAESRSRLEKSCGSVSTFEIKNLCRLENTHTHTKKTKQRKT